MASIPGQLSPSVLATILYNRLLLGLVIGVADGVDMHPLMRGAMLGAVVSLSIAIPSGLVGGNLLLAAGVIYGIIIDLTATRLS